MMSHFIFCFFLISFVGVFSDQRKVSLNSFVLLFDNVTADSLETEISLHKNGAKNPDLIVKWNFTNGDITAKWRMTNYNKIFMDGNKRIYIANIDKEYEGNYYIQYSQKHDEVDIIISGIGHDTTTTRSLIIETEGSSMMIGVLVMIIVVFVFMVARTVVPIYSKRACCHCKKENENEDQETLLKDFSWLPTEKFGKLKWENIMQLLNVDQQQGLRRHCEVLNGEHPQLWQSQLGNLKWENIIQLLNGDQLQSLRKHCERLIEEFPQLWQNHFGKLQWENIIQLLNGDQQQGLRKHCERLIEEFPQLWQNHFGKLQWENIMQLLNGDQQQGLRRHCEVLNGEYPQLWQRHFGKLQWENIMQLLNGDQQQSLRKYCDAEAEKIKDSESSKKRQNPKVMKRSGESTKDVYRFLCDNKLFDPNILE